MKLAQNNSEIGKNELLKLSGSLNFALMSKVFRLNLLPASGTMYLVQPVAF